MSEPICPICERNKGAKDYRPFCSKRCADIDLSRWLKGSYAIPGRPSDQSEEAPPGKPSDEG